MWGSPTDAASLVDQAGDGVPVQGGAALPRQQQRIACRDVPGPVVADEGDQVRVQRQVAVLVQFADGDVQPVRGADEHDRVSLQGSELADPQSGAEQHFHHDPGEHPRVGLGGAQQLRGGRVVKGLRERVVLAGQVGRDDRHPGRGFGPVPVADAHEEHPQGAQPVGEAGRGEPGGALPGPGGQPAAVVLDVVAADVGQEPHVGCLLGQERGQRAQRLIGVAHAARSQDRGQLLQIAAHRRGDVGHGDAKLIPVGESLWAAHHSSPSTKDITGASDAGTPTGNGLPGSSWASMASAARRYWEASQSSARCR